VLHDDIYRRITERALAADAHMPNWADTARGVPNSVLRSALFGAFGRGKRTYLNREPMASNAGNLIFYTGIRLDQSDLDVWEGIIHLSRKSILGEPIYFTVRGLLRLIGRGGLSGESIGKSDRDWLKGVISRLKAATIEIQQGPYAYGGSLIDEFFRDDDRGCYVVTLNPRMKVLFGSNTWTAVDWKIRDALRGHPVAQWLHGFYSSHAEPFGYKVSTLHRLCGSSRGATATTVVQRNKALQAWRDGTLIPALQILEIASNAVGQQFSWDLPCETLKVNRSPSRSQQKHIQRKLEDGKNRPVRSGDSMRTGRGIAQSKGG
jgi:hypothetical protein